MEGDRGGGNPGVMGVGSVRGAGKERAGWDTQGGGGEPGEIGNEFRNNVQY